MELSGEPWEVSDLHIPLIVSHACKNAVYSKNSDRQFNTLKQSLIDVQTMIEMHFPGTSTLYRSHSPEILLFLFSTWHAGSSAFLLNHKLTVIFMGSKL